MEKITFILTAAGLAKIAAFTGESETEVRTAAEAAGYEVENS